MTYDEIEFEKVVLTKLKIGLKKIITGQMLHDVNIRFSESIMIDGVILDIQTYVMKEDLKEQTYEFRLTYPKTWWDGFKEQYFPIWLENIFPVKYTTHKEKVKFSAYEVYPNLPKVYPDCGYHFTEIYMENE